MIDDETLNKIANWFQLLDFMLDITQISNDEIMKHLLEQDKVLDYQDKLLQEQTNDYLEKIISQNEEILKLLKGGKNEN